ncbi:unnamed protein product, partial [Prorocentrum cordatum]
MAGAGDSWLAALSDVGSDTAVDDDVGESWLSALGAVSDKADAGQELPQPDGDDWLAGVDALSCDDCSADGDVDGELDHEMALVPVEVKKDVYWASHACRHVPDSDLDESAFKIATEVMDDDPLTGRITSNARNLDESRSKYRDTLKIMAGCALQVERNVWKHAEELLVSYAGSSKRVELLCYVEYASYDSTDFILQSTQTVTETLDDGHSIVDHGAPP